MALTQTTLRSTLAEILSINPDYIVPKKGSWFNPQDITINGQKPDTWVAFKITQGTPRNLPMMQANDAGKNCAITWYIGYIELQFLGIRAEELAQTVPHWLHRSDVKSAFQAVDAELMADDASYKVDAYYQDGLNTEMSYRVSLKVLHSSVIETTQELWTGKSPSELFT